MRGANFIWDEENLERFIAKADETVPGNTLKPYGGLADRFLEDPRGRSIVALVLGGKAASSCVTQCAG
jgi:hypothetical protein